MQAKLTDKHVRLITETAVKTALDHLEKQKLEEDKKKYDRRLRNIKLLLRNYRSFVNHVEDIKIAIDDLNEKLELDDLETDEFAVRSIKKSKERTLAIVKYINKMIEVYKFMCEQSGDIEDQRRYQVVYEMYISEKKLTAKEIAIGHSVHARTIYKDVDRACETLAVLVFGVDGVRLYR